MNEEIGDIKLEKESLRIWAKNLGVEVEEWLVKDDRALLSSSM